MSQTFLIFVVLIISWPSSTDESHCLHFCCPDHQLCSDPYEASQTFLTSCITPSSLALSWSSWSESNLPHQLSQTFLISFVLIISFVMILMKWVRPSSSTELHHPQLCCPDYQLCLDPHEVNQTFLISWHFLISFVMILIKWVRPSSLALSWTSALSKSSLSQIFLICFVLIML